ncbi:MAG TPA: hypothetical protein VFI29_13660 [Hanamia sp.]|nr:hypothetical protein [Hanamia sp.]
MKLKNFFNSQRRNDLFQEIKNDFKPVLEKLSVPVTAYAKSHPKRTFFWMITIVVINMVFLFFFTDAFETKKGVEITDLKFESFKYGGNNGAAPEITVSFENIKKVRMIRDSLEYLMSLPHMSFQDTLTFVRIMDEFQKISSGTSGMPSLKLEDLRKIRQFNNPTIDTTIKQ